MDTDLQPLPEDWNTALAVVAHPDDMEYGASCAVARWTAAGKKVTYLLVTRGEAGIDGIIPKEAKKLRTKEQIASCAAVGVKRLEFLDHPDGAIADAMRLRREIASVIRRHRPDIVITLNHHETWGGRVLNLADHRIVGTAVLDAVRDAGNRHAFGDLRGTDRKSLPRWDEGAVHCGSQFTKHPHAVDITDSIAAGVESLRCHAVYLAGLGAKAPDPDKFLRDAAERHAVRFGGRLAATFEVYR